MSIKDIQMENISIEMDTLKVDACQNYRIEMPRFKM